MSIEWLQPWGLGLLGLLVPLIALYILKAKRQRRTVASTWLWRHVERDIMARSPFRRLRMHTSLFLQALIIIALALAAANPASQSDNLSGDHLVIVLDTSASMATQHDGRTRLQIGKERAIALLGTLPPTSKVTLVESGQRAVVRVPHDRDTRRVERAVASLRTSDEVGNLEQALALAIARLRQQNGRRKVVVITDTPGRNKAVDPSHAIEVQTVVVGSPVDNTAIVRADVRTGKDGRGNSLIEGFVVIAHYGRSPREAFVTMRQRGTSDILASRRVTVDPNKPLPVTLQFRPTEGDYGKGVVFEVAPTDALPNDDRAFGKVPVTQPLDVRLASREKPSPWLLRALASDPKVELRQMPLADLGKARGVADDAFVVVQGICPAELPGRDLLIVNPGAGPCFGTTVGNTVSYPRVTSWRRTDPRLRFVTLDDLVVRQSRSLKLKSQQQALVRSSDGALIADLSLASRTGTLIAFDVGESNWPLKASYVLFIRNLLEQARAARHLANSSGTRTGQPLEVVVPGHVRDVTVTLPDGQKRNIAARDGLAVLADTRHSGHYVASWKASDGRQGGSRLFAVNLTSSRESNLTQTERTTNASAQTGDEFAGASEGFQQHSWWLALLALFLIVIEITHRTRNVTPSAPLARGQKDSRRGAP